METDLTRIKKIAKEKDDENWLFRTFLKGVDSQKLDSIVHRLFKQVSKAIDCTSCANCCKKIRPGVQEKDILKLSKSIDSTPDRFIADYVEKNKFGEKVIRQVPCPFLRENKCTQYASRPAACASYPHLYKKDFAFRLIGVVHNYSVCPIVFNVYEALKDKYESEFTDFQDQMDDFYYHSD